MHKTEDREATPRVAFVIRRIPHYRLHFYELFTERNKHLNVRAFHGTPERAAGGSGLVYDAGLPFAVRLKSFKLGSLVFQRGLVKNGLINRYDVVVFEGSVRLASSFLVLIGRKLLRRPSILWLKGWPNEPRRIPFFRFVVRKLLLSLADSYVTYGHESLKSLSRYGVDTTKVTVAQNTVDVTDLLAGRYSREVSIIRDETARRMVAEGRPYIYNIGRIIPTKRVADLVDAFRRLTSTSAALPELIIAGNGPDLASLRRTVASAGSAGIHLLGTISEEESKVLYANCHFCVFPGAVGLSLNEAMAAGRAVICADEPGPDSELLIHEVNGLRYSRGNIADLVGCMRRLIEDEHLREALGRKALETISERATLENLVSRVSSVIEAQLKANGRATQ